jgi:hypothetical protein
LNKLKIKVAKNLIQSIVIPDFGIYESQTRTSHFVDGDDPTIFIAADTKHSLAMSFISQHLAIYFGLNNLAHEIADILKTEVPCLDELLRNVMHVPTLPNSLTEDLETNSLLAHLTEDPVADISEDSKWQGVGFSKQDAEEIIEIVQSAVSEEDHEVQVKMPNFELPTMDANTYNMDNLTAVMGSLATNGTASHRRHSSTSSRITQRSSLGRIQGLEYDPEEGMRKLKIGFAGEFYVSTTLTLTYEVDI